MDHPLPTFQNANFGCNASLLGSAFATTKVPAFISLQDCIGTVWDYSPLHKGLQANWQEAMAAQLGSALPLFKSGAVVGVFLGDEIMCSKIPFSNYSAVATATRKWLIDSGVPGALIYSNECSTPLTKSGQTWSVPDKLPAELDLFSIDLYAARASHSNPSSDPRKELEEVQKMVADHMRPRLHPHQRLMLVPGLFGDRNTTRSGTMEEQEEYLLAKLNATVAYAESQPDIVGVIPWHWLSPPKSYGIYSTIFGLGIESFPKLIARLNELKIKTDDDDAASAPEDYHHSASAPRVLAPPAAGARACPNNCSLNGVCGADSCVCDRPWEVERTWTAVALVRNLKCRPVLLVLRPHTAQRFASHWGSAQRAAHVALVHSAACACVGSRAYGESILSAGQPRPRTPSGSASVQTVPSGGGPEMPLSGAWSRNAAAVTGIRATAASTGSASCQCSASGRREDISSLC